VERAEQVRERLIPLRRLAIAFVALTACTDSELLPRGRSGADAATDAGTPSADVAAPAIGPGLELLGATIIPSDESGTPHATRLLDVGGRTIILDTNLVVGGPRSGKAWDLSFRSEPQRILRCTVGTISSATHSIYCGSPESPALVVFDSRDGQKKYPPAPQDPEVAAGSFDLVVTPRGLYSATALSGLERIPVDAAGLPDLAARKLILSGDIQALDGDGDARLAAADARARVLYLLENELVVRTIELDGPPVRVRVVGDEVQVAMASRGAVVIDWRTGAIRHRVSPLAVVSGTAKSGDLFAVATLTGLYVYDLARSAEIPIGFVPAEYGFLDVRFEGDELIAIDWRTIHAYRVHRDGHVMRVDAPLGYVLRKGDGIRFPVRNEGDLELTAAGVKVPPRGVGWIDVTPGSADTEVHLDDGVSGERSVRIARRDDRVALGGSLSFREPLANGRAVFALPDCALQFAEWKDVRYLNARGVEPRSTLIAVWDETRVPTWAALWWIDARPFSSFVEGGDEDLFNTRYGVTLMFGGADLEVTLDTDAASDVVNFSHQYRSIHALPRPVLLR
jgi:hypothetical protein